MRSRSTRPRSGLVFLAGALCGLVWAFALDLATRDPDLELFRWALERTEEDYVGDVDHTALVGDAVRGMLSRLDEHSTLYGPEDLARIDRETHGEFRGIGVVFLPPSSDGRVLFAVPGGPAARAGIRVGDRLVSVDSTPLSELVSAGGGGLAAHLSRSGGEPVTVTVEGLDGGTRQVRVHPELVLDPTVRHARLVDAEHGIGYLAIRSFSHRTPEEFDRAVSRLRAEGMRSLVVDLRSNPGGILDAAVELANRFVPEGVLVSTETAAGTTPILADPEKASLAGTPLVLLVDGNSASASEVLAGALQDHAAGALVGEPTYGKGTVQTLTPYRGRAILKLTTARYLTPGGRHIERHADGAAGLFPDVRVGTDETEKLAIYRYLATYSPPDEVLPEIRAWESSAGESLLPEPPADEQLQVAVGLLNGEVPDDEGGALH